MNRTVLITGAGGFVGSHLAQGFLAMGDAVVALDRAFDTATRQRLNGGLIVEQALTASAFSHLPKIDLVIHAAAITTPPDDLGISDAAHIEGNVSLLTTCLDFATRHGVSDFVFVSSSGVFAPEDGSGIHLETTPATSRLPYAMAKRAGEAATKGANSGSLRALSIRLGPIYGPNETQRDSRRIVSQIRRWLDAAGRGEPIIVTMPDEHRDWTFAPDLAPALSRLLAIEPKLTGIIHLTSADIIANLDLAQAVAALVDGSSVVSAPTDATPRLPMASVRLDMPSFYPWTSLTAGLQQTLEVAA